MPPKSRITKQMIIDCAYDITAKQGFDKVSVRTIASKLNCSTQPIMYYFKSINEIKGIVIERTDEFHTQYIMNMQSDEPLKDIGLSFIRFGAKYGNLFNLLFQSNNLQGKSMAKILEGDSVAPIIAVMTQAMHIEDTKAQSLFKIMALFVYGYASMLANNTIVYNEDNINKDLDLLYFSLMGE